MTASRVTASAGPRLFLHADDFGMSAAVNAAVVRGFTHGLLTSTSLLANGPGFEEACRLWRQLPAPHGLASRARREALHDALARFDLGAHLNLTQGLPLTGSHYPRGLVDERGSFPGIFRLFHRLAFSGGRYAQPIYQELRAQVARMVDAGLPPTHVNGHQYIELIPLIASLLPRLCREFGVSVVRVPREPGLWRSTRLPHPRPLGLSLAWIKRGFAARLLRSISAASLRHPHTFFGTAHAGLIRAAVVAEFLRVPRGHSVEIALHPGCEETAVPPDGWEDPLDTHRHQELQLLESVELWETLVERGMRLGRLQELASPALA